jgi:hypothetical protein
MFQRILPTAAFVLVTTLGSLSSTAATIEFDQTNQSPYLEDGYKFDSPNIVSGNCFAAPCLTLNGEAVTTMSAQNGSSFSVTAFWFQLLGTVSELTVTAYQDANIVDTIVLTQGDFDNNNGGQFYSHLFANITSLAFDNSGTGNLRIDNISAVPIPAALPLFGSALAGLGFIARRRNSKRAMAT